MEVPVGFDDAYVRLFVLARRVAERIVPDRAEAEDVAAETLTRALVRWSTVQSYAEAWVTRVATNQALDRLRRRPPTPDLPPSTSIEDEVSRRVDLVAAVAGLSGRQRQAVALRYLVGLDEDEIAAALGLRPLTVKTHLRRGLLNLRRRHAGPLQEVP